ncbi:unnamed protein product [Schistosoma curassoni]|uniref:Uncharacterized protein n=1 Tax=Schistosoma curassoni TaxID=6186 RepID=A0A183KNW8_9TREM|nr:unnamed protein product [Schistosoma curassoni]
MGILHFRSLTFSGDNRTKIWSKFNNRFRLIPTGVSYQYFRFL